MADDIEVLISLVILDGDRRILVDIDDSGCHIPTVTIPPYSRIVLCATEVAKDKYGVDLFGILSVPSGAKNQEPLEEILVCRMKDAHTEVPVGLRWIGEKDYKGSLTEHSSNALEFALKEFDVYDSGAKASSFGKYISLDELRAWYLPILESRDVRETGIQQWNADPWFSLIRISVAPLNPTASNSPAAFWFKAVGEPNTRELPVTRALSLECPLMFPEVIATNPRWNGWLMEEVRGHELDEETDSQSWIETARDLATIQMTFADREAALLEYGCRDWRMPRVLDSLGPFFEDMEDVMQRQPSAPPDILGRKELQGLRGRCEDLCHQIAMLNVPSSIAHGDFSPHNVLVSQGRRVFIDWAEAYVTFPFISWEYYWNRTVKDHPDYAGWHSRMLNAYAYDRWASILGDQRVREALRLSPAAAVLVIALYGADSPAGHASLDFDRVRRSLVRRLRKELDQLELVNVL